MNRWLPKTLEIDGIEYNIDSDFRNIIFNIFVPLKDKSLTPNEQMIIILNNLFVDENGNPLPLDIIENQEEAVKQANWFLNWGDTGENNSYSVKSKAKLLDWEQDWLYITSAVDMAMKTAESCLELDYMHFWTFLAKFNERPNDCRLNNIINIRAKRAEGKALDKAEKQFFLEHKDKIIFKENMIDDDDDDRWWE